MASWPTRPTEDEEQAIPVCQSLSISLSRSVPADVLACSQQQRTDLYRSGRTSFFFLLTERTQPPTVLERPGAKTGAISFRVLQHQRFPTTTGQVKQKPYKRPCVQGLAAAAPRKRRPKKTRRVPPQLVATVGSVFLVSGAVPHRSHAPQ